MTGTEFRNARPMNDEHDQFLIEQEKRLRRLRDLLTTHPDAILLNEAAESLEEKKLLPNLIDPSLPAHINDK